jgi:hypothetical protein
MRATCRWWGQEPLAGVTAPTTRIGTPGAPPARESVDLPPGALPRERRLGALPDQRDRGDRRDHDPGGLEPAHQVAVGGVLSGYTGPPGPPGGCAGSELAREGLPQAERPFI